MSTIELLSPAGTFDALKGAVRAGADAVYLGGPFFGARAFAGNFTKEELLEALDYSHLRDVRIYLTVNTLLKENELKEALFPYLKPLYEAGLDGVIVQDTGAIAFIHSAFPDLPIHASTQMNITSEESIRLLEELGVCRVIPARELSLSEIRKIAGMTSMEIECFVHGAMCFCYSGQCEMSSMLGGRSGNRGRCAQPCRLPYKFGTEGPSYCMSMKDMNTIEILPQLMESGISSFKIEGRMKSMPYTEEVTQIYRKYMDLYEHFRKAPADQNSRHRKWEVDRSDMRFLKEAYSRSDSSTGYWEKRRSGRMITVTAPGYTALGTAEKQSSAGSADQKERRRMIEGTAEFLRGKPSVLTVTCGAYCVTVKGEEATDAVSRPITEQDVSGRLGKTGGTPFQFQKLSVRTDGNVYCSIKGINELRRQALACLSAKILESRRRKCNDCMIAQTGYIPERAGRNEIRYSAGVLTDEQFAEALSSDIGLIYPEPELWMTSPDEAFRIIDKCRSAGKMCCLAMPYIFRDDCAGDFQNAWERGVFSKADGVMIRNLEEAGFLLERGYSGHVTADEHLYTWNSGSRNVLRGFHVDTDTVPFELSRREIEERGTAGSEMLLYGRIPLMITAQCLTADTGGCQKKESVSYLTDRMNARFPVRNCCHFCYNVIYNSVPSCLLSERKELIDAGLSRFRFSFTVETAAETREILSFLDEEKEFKESGIPFTRGHYRHSTE